MSSSLLPALTLLPVILEGRAAFLPNLFLVLEDHPLRLGHRAIGRTFVFIQDTDPAVMRLLQDAVGSLEVPNESIQDLDHQGARLVFHILRKC